MSKYIAKGLRRKKLDLRYLIEELRDVVETKKADRVKAIALLKAFLDEQKMLKEPQRDKVTIRIVDEEILRKMIDWYPHENQQKILDSPAKIKVICAGRGFGKSSLCAYIALARLLEDRKKIAIIAPCVDEKTEILTKRGWLKRKELKVRDYVLTLNKEGRAEWQKCLGIKSFSYNDKLISIETKRHSSLTTPHHRWLVGYLTRSRKDKKAKIGGFRFIRSDQFNKSNEFVLGSAPVINLPQKEKYSNDFVELVAWYWAEGGRMGNGGRIAQNRGWKASRIKKVLFNLFNKPRDERNYSQTNKKEWGDWRQKTKGLPEQGYFYLNKNIVKEIERHCSKDKILNPKFIVNLTKEQLELFLKVAIWGDGHERKYERIISQKNKERLDGVQMITQLAGYQTNLIQRKDGKFILYIYKRNRMFLGSRDNRPHFKKVHYKGIVWCPQTPNKTWLARREGKVYFTGNTYDLTGRIREYLNIWISKCFKKEIRIHNRPLPKYIAKWGSYIDGLSAEKPEIILGKGYDVIIVDECALIDKRVHDTYIATASRERQAEIYYIGTPRGRNWFWEMWVKEKEKGGSFRFTSIDNPHFPKEIWEEKKKRFPEMVFQQEHEAIFLEEATVFKGLDRCLDKNLDFEDYNPKHYYHIGLDLGRYESFTAIAVIDLVLKRLVYYNQWREPDWELSKERIISVLEKYGKSPTLMDSTTITVGDAYVHELLNKGYDVRGYKLHTISKRQLIEKLIVSIQNAEIKIPDIPETESLIEQLRAFTFSITPSGHIAYHSPQGIPDDGVIALALACWELTEEPLPEMKEGQPEVFAFPYQEY